MIIHYQIQDINVILWGSASFPHGYKSDVSTQQCQWLKHLLQMSVYAEKMMFDKTICICHMFKCEKTADADIRILQLL